MNTHKIRKANDISDAPPTRGQYDEDAIRRDARELIVEQQRVEIDALKAENERLLGCIAALEREGLEKPHQGFSSYDAFADAREWDESPRSDGQDGRLVNTTGAWAHLS